MECRKIKLVSLAFLLILGFSKSGSTDCYFPMVQVELDTLPDESDLGVVRTVTDIFMNTVTVDTVYRSDFIAGLVEHYRNAKHVFVATADTFFLFPQPTSDEPGMQAYTDSVLVRVDTVLKSEGSRLSSGERFTIVKKDLLFNSLGTYSYGYLYNRHVLRFVDEMIDYASLFEHPMYCRIPEDYILNGRNEIVHDSFLGITIPFEMFMDALTNTTLIAPFAKRTGFAFQVQTVTDGTIRIEFQEMLDYPARVALFNLAGKRAGVWDLQKDGKVFNLDCSRGLGKGLYTIVINGKSPNGSHYSSMSRFMVYH